MKMNAKVLLENFSSCFSVKGERSFKDVLCCNSFPIHPSSTLLNAVKINGFCHLRKSINDIHFPRQNFQVFLMLIISHCFSRIFVSVLAFLSFSPLFLCVWPNSLHPSSLVTKSPETINAKHKSFISSVAYQFSKLLYSHRYWLHMKFDCDSWNGSGAWWNLFSWSERWKKLSIIMFLLISYVCTLVKWFRNVFCSIYLWGVCFWSFLQSI